MRFLEQKKNLKKKPVEEASPYSYIFALPTCCDLTASTIASLGLLWVDASIWQMMRGAIIIFGAILSLVILRKRLQVHNWLGISLVVVGLFFVGFAGFLKNADGNNNNTNKVDTSLFFFGIVLVLIAQVIQALQMIIEEILLKKRNFEPLNVVFMEGFWGITIMTCVVFPVLYFIRPLPIGPDKYSTAPAQPVFDIFTENIFDSFYQMSSQNIFLFENLILLFSIAFFNFFGLSLTRYLSTVHRTLIDACRTVTVWLFQVILRYVFNLTDAGESVGWFSILQLIGFIFLVLGTIIYNEVFKISCSKYDSDKEEM